VSSDTTTKGKIAMSHSDINVLADSATRPIDKKTQREQPWKERPRSELLPKFLFIRDRALPLHLNGSALACLIHLVDRYDAKRGKTWPTSYEKLMALTGYGRNAVKRALAELVRRGLIKRNSGHTGRTNDYFMDIYGDQAPMGDRVPMGDLYPATTGDLYPATTGDLHTSSLPRSSRVGEEKRAAAGAALPADAVGPRRVGLFGEFWAACPRKEGIAAAERAYADVCADGVPHATLVAKIEQYGRAYAEKPERMKWPATWLRDKCWLEDPQPPRPKGAKPERAAKAAAKPKRKRVRKAERVTKAAIAPPPPRPAPPPPPLTEEQKREREEYRRRAEERREQEHQRWLEEDCKRRAEQHKQEAEQRRLEAQRERAAPWRQRWLEQEWEEDEFGEYHATVEGFRIDTWDDGDCRAQISHDKYQFDSICCDTIAEARRAAVDMLLDSPEFAKEVLAKEVLQ
jgi:hypothetical protein